MNRSIDEPDLAPSTEDTLPDDGFIRIRNARAHNLRGIDVEIPLGKVTAITGVSGSGKTSLAIETLYAEGQRRYVETFPIGARRYLPRGEKPAVDGIENLPPALAVTQHHADRAGDATVGSATGLVERLRVLFGRLSEPYCPACQQAVRRATPESVASEIANLPDGSEVLIAWPLGPGLDPPSFAAELISRGFLRIEWKGRIIHLANEATPALGPDDTIRVIVDRVRAGQTPRARLIESLETAFGQARNLDEAAPGGRLDLRVEGDWRRRSSAGECPGCGANLPVPDPRHFTPASDLGRCPTCDGLGTIKQPATRKAASKEAGKAPCPECLGTGLGLVGRTYRLAGLAFPGFLSQSVGEARRVANAYDAGSLDAAALAPLRQRLDYLERVGLGYLSLDRPMKTLATGEARRVALTNALGTRLAQTLYVLDEPTAGLHPADTAVLLGLVRELTRDGNTVVMVEHDTEAILASDYVIDLGPGAGPEGGDVIYSGPPAELHDAEDSVTAEYLSLATPPREPTRLGPRMIHLDEVRTHNLKGIDVAFPLGCLCVVAGVSGAGKSSLVLDTLVPALQRIKRGEPLDGLALRALHGAEVVDEVVVIDADSVGRTRRAVVATYLKAFDEIRERFAETLDAKASGLTAADFSFNRPGGQCPRCEGTGQLDIDMQFLPDVSIPCPECGGDRYQERVLRVKYRGRTIAETLELSAREAFGFFRGEAAIQKKLSPLLAVGLDYLALGQSTDSLSGGEAHRLAIATRLGVKRSAKSLLVFEEPTIGLHPADIEQLLTSLRELIAVGQSIIVIDHDPQVIRSADHVIELGPGAGEAGGMVIAAGAPAIIAKGDTATGRAIRTGK